MKVRTLDNFYVTEEELRNSPSRRDGVDAATEEMLRQYACEVVQEACILLDLPQVVAATAQVFLHRFLCKRSVKKFHMKKIAFTCLWMAVKTDEQTHKTSINKISMVFSRVVSRREGMPVDVLDPGSSASRAWNAEINTVYELEILKSFGFICHVEHPHKMICNMIGMLFLNQEEVPSVRDTMYSLIQEAWDLANTSLRTTLCVRHMASTVAVACIHLASRRMGFQLHEGPTPWWELFLTKSLHDINVICQDVLAIHSLTKPVYVSVLRKPPPTLDPPTTPPPNPTPNVTSPRDTQLPLPSGFSGGTTSVAAETNGHVDERNGRRHEKATVSDHTHRERDRSNKRAQHRESDSERHRRESRRDDREGGVGLQGYSHTHVHSHSQSSRQGHGDDRRRRRDESYSRGHTEDVGRRVRDKEVTGGYGNVGRGDGVDVGEVRTHSTSSPKANFESETDAGVARKRGVLTVDALLEAPDGNTQKRMQVKKYDTKVTSSHRVEDRDGDRDHDRGRDGGDTDKTRGQSSREHGGGGRVHLDQLRAMVTSRKDRPRKNRE